MSRSSVSFHFIYLFVFGCAGSSLLYELFSSCGDWGLLSSCGAPASHCSGFSCCWTQALGAWASVVLAPGLENTGSAVVVHVRPSASYRSLGLNHAWVQGLGSDGTSGGERSVYALTFGTNLKSHKTSPIKEGYFLAWLYLSALCDLGWGGEDSREWEPQVRSLKYIYVLGGGLRLPWTSGRSSSPFSCCCYCCFSLS